MKHKHAEYIAPWIEDNESVQYKNRLGQWLPVPGAGLFDCIGFEFRHTPKPNYSYFELLHHGVLRERKSHSNARATFVDGKLVAVELLKEGDGL